MSHKLTFEEFDELNKTALYEVFSDRYNQKEDYHKILKVINSRSHANKDEIGLDFKISKQSQKNRKRVSPFPMPDETKNSILGSKITARIRTETLPNETIVHSYKSSTTEEKIKAYCVL